MPRPVGVNSEEPDTVAVGMAPEQTAPRTLTTGKIHPRKREPTISAIRGSPAVANRMIPLFS